VRTRLEPVRAAYGALLLGAPDRALRSVGVVDDGRARVVVRVLGIRHLAQSLLSGDSPGPALVALGAWVDSAHAATSIGLAVVDRDRRRAGCVDAAVAATWAALGYRDLRSGRVGGSSGTRERLAGAVLGFLPGARRPVHEHGRGEEER
jgi:hypothetical protein